MEEEKMYCITKWTKHVTDSGEDEYTNRLPNLKCRLKEKYGSVPPLYKFRLLDDDGVVYAYGISDDDSSFAPLDRYMNDYGVTEIQYKNPKTGQYETL
jgi:hypothetical protein